MQPNFQNVSFNLFGFPTAIQPFFWVVAALITALSLGDINNNMPIWLAHLFVGTMGVLLSILVHELGHALVFRYVLRVPSAIVLHGFGGMTMPLQHFPRQHGFNGALAHCFLAFAGPLAGFMLAFVMIVISLITPADGSLITNLFHYFLSWTARISIFWGIINLMPIYPIDGGQISREIFLFFSPRQGVRVSLIVSMMVAILLAVFALQHQSLIIALFFAFFAYQNYQEMTFGSFRR